MARFVYAAKDPAGVERADVLHAESSEAAVDMLHGQGLVVLSIREAHGPALSGSLFAGASFGGRVRPGVVALFTRQLATMQRAGLPLIRALNALSGSGSSKALSRVIMKVAGDIQRGENFSGALARHPRTFSSLYVSLVRSGEGSGALHTILDQLGRYLERTEAIKRKVKSAMAYPAVVLGFVMLASSVLFLKVVPMMAGIYDKLGAELPGVTKIVIAASNIARTHIWVLFLVLAVLAGVRALLRRTVRGRLFLDSGKLRMPIFGPILRKTVVAKFVRTLGVLVDSGLPIMESLELARGAAGNEVIAQAADDIRESISLGASLSAGFASAHVFPDIVVQMVSTGEETGSLGEMLSNVSDFYDEQVETSISGLSSIIEPLMIIFVGGIIALILVAMFLPIFHMGGAIRQGLRGAA